MNKKIHDWNEKDFNKIKSYLGSKLEIIEYNDENTETDGYLVLGFIDKYDSINKSFDLLKTYVNGVYCGEYTIFERDIKKWKINTLVNNNKHLANNRTNANSKKSTKLLLPEKRNDSEEEQDILSLSSELESIDLKEDDQQIQVNIGGLKLKTSQDILVFQVLNSQTVRVIKHLKSFKIIGFCLFGRELSRYGSIDLFVFTTEEGIYVFKQNADIIQNLKPIIESEDILKVMYNCRYASDALNHAFKSIPIKLNNVFDIYISDFLLQKYEYIKSTGNARNGFLPQLRSFDLILRIYLKLKIPNSYPTLDYSNVSIRVENMIIIKTIFLRELHHIIDYRINKELHIMTNRYLESLRCANRLEYMHMKDPESELEIIENPIETYEQKERRFFQKADKYYKSNGLNAFDEHSDSHSGCHSGNNDKKNTLKM